jgi:hypothetical protein
MRIAIDPGHIGGEWAKMEARWFVIGQGTPVSEGDMTLRVANLLKPQLEAMGAQVSMVRSKNEPVTTLRPDSLRSLALDSSTAEDSPAALQSLAERLFYRTAEIHARAELVNRTLKPDLVIVAGYYPRFHLVLALLLRLRGQRIGLRLAAVGRSLAQFGSAAPALGSARSVFDPVGPAALLARAVLERALPLALGAI